MRIPGIIAGLLIVGGCAAAEPEPLGYAVSSDDARATLLAAKFPKGVIPNFSRHNIDFVKVTGGGLEWKVVTDDGVGFTCQAKIMPANAEDTRSVVINSCDLPFGSRAAQRTLDELVAEKLNAPTADS
jgi:hypothetical protein